MKKKKMKVFKKWRRREEKMSIEEEIVKALCDVFEKARRDAIIFVLAIIATGITIGLVGVRSGIDTELLRSIGFWGGLIGILVVLLVRIPIKFIWGEVDATFVGLPHFSNKQVKDFLIAGSYNHLKVPF